LFSSKIGTFYEIVGDYFVKKVKSSDFERIHNEKRIPSLEKHQSRLIKVGVRTKVRLELRAVNYKINEI
jgi:hypothetical protein